MLSKYGTSGSDKRGLHRGKPRLSRAGRVLPFVLAVLMSAVGGATSGHAAFPGANGKIAFVSDRDGAPEIYVMDADGASVTRLTFNGVSETSPRWSPDGTRLGFVEGGSRMLYVLGADGSARTLVRANVGSFDWSPDGTEFVFETCCSTPNELRRMAVDGTNERPIITANPTGGYVAQPAWSPDGGRIAFVQENAATNAHGIYVIDPDGGSAQQLTSGSFDYSPDWSPDSTRLVFQRFVSTGFANEELFTVVADGSGETRLTNNDVNDYEPVWSPDGMQILFSRKALFSGSTHDLHVMPASGGASVSLTSDPATDADPSWQPRMQTRSPAFESVAAQLWNGLVGNADGYDLRVDWNESGLEPGSQVAYHITFDATRTIGCTNKRGKVVKSQTERTSFTSVQFTAAPVPPSGVMVNNRVVYLDGGAGDAPVFSSMPRCKKNQTPILRAVTYKHVRLHDDTNSVQAKAVPSKVKYRA